MKKILSYKLVLSNLCKTKNKYFNYLLFKYGLIKQYMTMIMHYDFFIRFMWNNIHVIQLSK